MSASRSAPVAGTVPRRPSQKMWELLGRHSDLVFILVWTALNLFQIATTELTSDEGYYWFYSTRLEWGYYDHPPFLAVLISLGTSLFAGEFGVRLFNVLLMSGGIFVLLSMMSPQERRFAYPLFFSIPLLNYITFIAFPDTPLVALSAFALYGYRRLLKENDLAAVLILGGSFALMLYSKYHAAVFIGLLVLSNPQLFRSRNFYLAAGFAGLLFLPHLWWQHTHGYPTVLFHLQGRAGAFEIDHLLEYVAVQLLVVGVGVIFCPFLVKARDAFDRALIFISVGTLVFFAFTTLRGYVHIHWTSVALFPLIMLASRYYAESDRRRLFGLLVLPYLFVILALRVYFAFQIIPVNAFNVDYYHKRDLWAEDIRAIAGDRPVVFDTGNGGLREAPLYQFYTGGQSLALFPGDRKKSQYQLWNYEDRVQDMPVMLVGSGAAEGAETLKTRMGRDVRYRLVDRFASFNNVRLDYDSGKVSIGESVVIPLTILNHRDRPISFDGRHRVYVHLKQDGRPGVDIFRPLDGLSVPPHGTQALPFEIDAGEIGPGTFEFYFGIDDGLTARSVNSERGVIAIP